MKSFAEVFLALEEKTKNRIVTVVALTIWISVVMAVGLLAYGLTYRLWVGIVSGIIAIPFIPLFYLWFVDWYLKSESKIKSDAGQVTLLLISCFTIGFVACWKWIIGEKFLADFWQALGTVLMPLIVGLFPLVCLGMIYQIALWILSFLSAFCRFIEKILHITRN